jgi:hypothetical protein
MAKERFVQTTVGRVASERATTLQDQDLLAVTFDIDSTISKVPEEHMKLASYMKECMLNIDVFDADS